MNIRLKETKRGVVPANLSLANKFMRLVWQLVWLVLYRYSPVPLHVWRRFLLRLFGAAIARGCHPYPSSRVWAPWNLVMEENSCLGHGVICYNVGKISLREGAIISQNVHLCGATHDYRSADFDLYAGDIEVGKNAWVCADAFIGPGINIADESVINARAVLFSDTGKGEVYSGNPAQKVRMRYKNECV